jgi:hypothetical protein
MARSGFPSGFRKEMMVWPAPPRPAVTRNYFLRPSTSTRTICLCIFQKRRIFNSVAVPDPGSGMSEKSESGSGMNKPDHISENLTIFLGKNILMRVRDGTKSDPG